MPAQGSLVGKSGRRDTMTPDHNTPPKGILASYLDYGIAGLSPRRARQQKSLNVLSLLVAQSGLAYAAFYLIYDAPGLWPAAAVVSLFVLFLGIPMLARRHEVLGLLAASGGTIILQMVLAWMLSMGSGLHLFILNVPGIGIVLFGTTRIALSLGVTTVCVVALAAAALRPTTR